LDPIHHKILSLIEENPRLSQRKLAEKLGVSLGKINYCWRSCKNSFLEELNIKSTCFIIPNRYYVSKKSKIQESSVVSQRNTISQIHLRSDSSITR
jgi:hypothetical protein